MQLDASTPVSTLMDGIPTAAFHGERRVIVGHLEDTLAAAQQLFFKYDLHHLPIVSEQDRLVGIVSVRDVMTAYAESMKTDPALVQCITLREIMTPNPTTLRAQTPVREALSILANASFQALPVVDRRGRVEGIVTTRDLVRWTNARVQRAAR